MTKTEMKSIDETIERKIRSIKEALSQRFQKIDIYGDEIYVLDSGFSRLSYLQKLNCVVMEYAESEEYLEKNMFEDGDLYELDMEVDEIVDGLCVEMGMSSK